MRPSTERILTTHAGSLPRDALQEAWSKPTSGQRQERELEQLLRSSVRDVVKAQADAGVDVPNDGEFGKPMRAASDLAAWGTYIYGRICGFGPTPPGAAAPDHTPPGHPMRIVGERWEQREFSGFYAKDSLVPAVASRPTCIGPIKYTGEDALCRDLTNLKAAGDAAGVQEAFVTRSRSGETSSCPAASCSFPASSVTPRMSSSIQKSSPIVLSPTPTRWVEKTSLAERIAD